MRPTSQLGCKVTMVIILPLSNWMDFKGVVTLGFIGLVDTTKACQPSLKMAVDKNLLFEGWCKVGKLKINK